MVYSLADYKIEYEQYKRLLNYQKYRGNERE